MTEIKESIAALVAGTNSTKDKCWYCKEKPKKHKKLDSDSDAEPDTDDANGVDAILENNTNNCATKLAASMVKRNVDPEPAWFVNNPGSKGKSKITPGAHHCVPGGASLAKAKKILALIDKKIGYSVNHRNNGVWLPGNYAVRPGIEGWTRKWSTYNKAFKDKYAANAMESAGNQFHDAHSRYNRKVLACLEALETKLESKDGKCPICGDDYDDKRPPYGLVGRLDAISAEHRAMLVGVAKRNVSMKRTVEAGYYTSSRVKTYYGVS